MRIGCGKNKKKKIMAKEKKIYEQPNDTGIWFRFHDAVRVLCTETGPLKKRLYRAYYDCGIVHLYSSNFRDEYIDKRLKYIEDIVSIGMPKLSGIAGVYFQVNCLHIHWKQATKMAETIFEIYEYIAKYHFK